MKRISLWVTIFLLLGLIPLAFVAPGALRVAVGYSAKQLCSGVFVGGLDQDFVIERDIRSRLAVLGPALARLKLSLNSTEAWAEASLLGVSARAVHVGIRGCALHSGAPGVAPLERVANTGDPVLEIASPALQTAIDRLFSEPEGSGRNTLALLVTRNGQLLSERYAEDVQADHRLQGWSMNKSLMATWVGMQAQRGELDPALPLREPGGPAQAFDNLHEDLTLLHLLQMESGLGFREFYGPGSDVTRMLYTAPAMWTVPATSGAKTAPGERFAYSSGDLVLASYVWQQSLTLPYEQWIATFFSEPLGIHSLIAEADASGVQVGSSYAYMTARDWLRVGQFWLDALKGRSDLLSRQWMRDSVTPRASSEQGRYGRGFWLNTGGIAFPDLPESAFYASGSAGQYLLVIPEWEMVVLRLGLTATRRSTGMQAFLKTLADERDALP